MGKKNRNLSMKQKQEDHERSEKELQNLRVLYKNLLNQTKEDAENIESLLKANEKFDAENTRIRHEFHNMESTNKFLKRRHVRFNKVVEIKELKRVNECLRTEINGLRDKVTKLEKNEALLDHVNGLDKNLELEGLVLENNPTKKPWIVELEKTSEANGEEFEEVKPEEKNLIKEKKELENRYDSLRDENGMLRKDIELVHAEKMELEKKLKYLEETLKNLTKENKVLNDHVIGLDMNLDVVMKKEKVREEYIKELMKENSKKDSEREIALIQVSEKEKLAEHFLCENKIVRAKIVSLLQEKDALEVELAHSVTENKGLRDELLSENKIYGEKIKSLVQEKNALEAELAHSVTENNRLRDELLCENKNAGEKIETLIQDKDSLEAELAYSVTENNRLRNELLCENKNAGEKIETLIQDKDALGDEKTVKTKNREIDEQKIISKGCISEKKNEKDEILKRINKERTKFEKILKEKDKEIDQLKIKNKGFVNENIKVKEEILKERTNFNKTIKAKNREIDELKTQIKRFTCDMKKKNEFLKGSLENIIEYMNKD